MLSVEPEGAPGGGGGAEVVGGEQENAKRREWLLSALGVNPSGGPTRNKIARLPERSADRNNSLHPPRVVSAARHGITTCCNGKGKFDAASETVLELRSEMHHV